VSSTLLVCLAFFTGSIPTGILLTRAITGQDVRHEGSGNIGAANVARAAGIKVGAAVAVLDVFKGLVPVLLGLWAGLDHTSLALVALAAVAGHDFSIFLRLKGGKGVATTFGAALALAPPAALATILVWIVVLAISSIASLASLLALALLPVFMALSHQPPGYVAVAGILFLLAAAKHYENIIRLAHGAEPGFRKRHPADGT
jgi:glycerol-3-phosphate acyltransferase PlsY